MMALYPVMGRLRIPVENLEENVQFLQDHLDEVSAPQPEKSPGAGHARFYSVEFMAAPEQWRLVRPELAERGIVASLYENPDLTLRSQRQLERLMEQSKRRGNMQLIPILGVILIIGGTVSLFVLHWWILALGLVLLGLVAIVAGRLALDNLEEGVEDTWQMRRRR